MRLLLKFEIFVIISTVLLGCHSSTSSSSSSRDLFQLYKNEISLVGSDILNLTYGKQGFAVLHNDKGQWINSYSTSCVYKEESYLTDEEDYYLRVIYKYTCKQDVVVSKEMYAPALVKINKKTKEVSYSYPKCYESKRDAMNWLDNMEY